MPVNIKLTNMQDIEGAVADFTNLETVVNNEPKRIFRSVLEDESGLMQCKRKCIHFKDTEFGIKARLDAQRHRRRVRDNYDECLLLMATEEGEHTLFLGLTSQSKSDCILLVRYSSRNPEEVYFVNVKTASTPIETQKPLVKIGSHDQTLVATSTYRSRICSAAKARPVADVGKTREIVDEEKELDEDKLSTEMCILRTRERLVPDDQNEGTEEQIESTDGQRKGTEDHTEERSATQSN
ncbi:hypothetical protein Tco_0556817 [Tanacetum coccineum]